MGELYTCKDVAERYGVQIITVWEWIRKKKLGADQLGKCGQGLLLHGGCPLCRRPR